jgi:lipopolysaccharide biosynthesis glycosyltransferase
MRGGIRDLVSAIFGTILAGAEEDEVYASWRALTRDRVAEARVRFEAPVTDVPTTIDVAAAVATSRAGSRQFGPPAAVDRDAVTDVVLAFDQNLTTPAAVLLESIVTHASGSLRLWVLARGLTGAYEAWLGAAFPTVPMTFVPCDRITYGPAGRPRRIPARITISTMDRLLLPNLLPDVDRVVYLDVDTLMLDDVCSLAATDLGGRPVAARDSNVLEMEGWQSAVRPLAEEQATELRRRMALRHGFGHAALNAGVLVMDLARMRRDDFAATYLAWVEQYGLHDQDIMLAYVGPDRCVLEPRWNSLPVLEDVRDASLIHWAAFGKPWDPQLTFEKDRWLGYAGRLRNRAGDPPTPA